MSITSDFFKRSRIEQNVDTIAMMDFLSSADSVDKMIIASDRGLPAITLVVEELESRFGDCDNAPLNHNGVHQNSTNRQNVGRMVKYIMAQFGYIPETGGLNERARIPKFAKAKYFSTAAVYSKERNAKYRITKLIV